MLVNVSVTPKALWYIETHLSEELPLETIAQASGVSKFHLSRAFASSMGLSLAAYIRARRLGLAAKQLLDGAPDILAVALDAGYGSHEAFTRAFRQQFGVTPEQARSQNLSIPTQEPLRMNLANTTPLAPPRLAQQEALLIFGLPMHCERAGDPGIPPLWNRFGPYIGNIDGQIGHTTYGVIYNAEEAGKFDYLCGVAVSSFPAHPAEFARLRVPAQTYAVFEHREHISAIAGTFKAIWEHGLAGLQPVDAPWLEVYGESFDPHTGMGGLEIWVPVKAG